MAPQQANLVCVIKTIVLLAIFGLLTTCWPAVGFGREVEAWEVPQPAPPGVEVLPITMRPNGVLFQVRAPNVKNIYVCGNFNGWGTRNGLDPAVGPEYRMYGPYEGGLYEYFAPLSPGLHAFVFALEGRQRIYGDKSLMTAPEYFKNNGQQGDYDLTGSVFQFSLNTPPWPAYVPTDQMLPAVLVSQEAGARPYLRVRYFSRTAKSVHVMGNWDNWGGNVNIVDDTEHRMKPTKVGHVWEYMIGPLDAVALEYKFVIDSYSWIADPCVVEANKNGNSIVQIANQGDKWAAVYTPRFDPSAARKEETKRWGELDWIDDREMGFSHASMGNKKMLWVITMPGSKRSDDYMKAINADSGLVAGLKKDFICLETPAHEVYDIIQKQRIAQLPYVVLVDSHYKPAGTAYMPNIEALKAQLRKLQ